MMCYLDRMFCLERHCATECHRRFFGTAHEANANRLGGEVVGVSFCYVRGTENCPGYTNKEVTTCSATDANTER